MTITFENDNDVIIYALVIIISYARSNQYIFLAQCVWWLASVIGLQNGLVIHIDNLNIRPDVSSQLPIGWDIEKASVHPGRVSPIHDKDRSLSDSKTSQSCTSENEIHDRILNNCEESLRQLAAERNQVARKSLKISKTMLRKSAKSHSTQTEGIEQSELT